jgi:hypothetical protein
MRHSFSLRSVLLLWMVCPKSTIASSQLRGSVEKLEESPGIPIDRRLQNNDQTSIQEVLTESIPATTFELRNSLDDPLELDLTATVPLDCDTLKLEMDFGMLRGLTTVNLDYLTLQQGSETVSDNCLPNQKLWKGAVDVYVSFGSALVSGQVGARIIGSCLGVAYNSPLTVSVSSLDTYLDGVANMEGTWGRVNAITRTNFLGRLTLTSDITSTVSLIPDDLDDGVADAVESQIEAAFRNQLVKVVEPHIRQKLELLIPAKLIGRINALVGYVPQLLQTFAENIGMLQGEDDTFVFEDDLYNFDDDA